MEVNKTNVPEGQPSGILLFKGEVSNYVLRPVPKSQNPIFWKNNAKMGYIRNDIIITFANCKKTP